MTTNNNPPTLEQMLASFIEEQRRFNEGQQHFNDTISEKFDGLHDGLETVKDNLENVNKGLTKVQNGLGVVQVELKTAQKDLVDVKGGLKTVHRGLNDVQNDIKIVKGGHARNEVLREANLVASKMGYRFVKNLSRKRIADIAKKAVGFDPDALDSFCKADVVMEVADNQERKLFIAVEASYTVLENDVSRAVRNAEYLRKLTEQDAYAAVAGVDIVPAAKRSVDAGDVYWYEVPRRDVQPE